MNKVLLAIAIGLALVLVACQPAPAPAPAAPPPAQPAPVARPPAAPPTPMPIVPKKGGALKIGFQFGITSMSPVHSRSAHDQMPLRNIYDTLVYFNPKTGAPEPMLATSWRTPDHTTWEFKLRKDVKFHDGSVLDASAVKKFFDWVLDPDTKSNQRADIGVVDRVEAPDADTLILKLKSPSTPLLDALYGRAGMVYSPAAIDKYGAKDAPRFGVGSGPFVMKEFKSDSHVLLERNPSYWQKDTPLIDEVRYQIIMDRAVFIASLRSAQVDVIWNVPTSDIEGLRKEKGLSVVEGADAVQGGWVLNGGSEAFKDVNLRAAVAWATGPEDVIKVANFGLGRPSSNTYLFPAWAQSYDPSPTPFKKDIARAKEFLAKAGKPGGFTFKVMYWAPVDSYLDVMRANLAEAGITMVNDKVEIGTFSTRNSKGEYDAQFGVTRLNGILDPGTWVRRFVWSKAPFNGYNFRNEQADKMMLDAEATTDPLQRKKLYNEINRLLNVEGYYRPPVFFSPDFVVSRDYVKGLLFHQDGYLHLYGTWVDK